MSSLVVGHWQPFYVNILKNISLAILWSPGLSKIYGLVMLQFEVQRPPEVKHIENVWSKVSENHLVLVVGRLEATWPLEEISTPGR